jgi:hypothetical protein
VSADFETEHYRGYRHEGSVYITTKPGEWPNEMSCGVGMFTPQDIREFQEIIDQMTRPTE